jgi:predicted  nucleic acid-binding Zn-ribbon protein
MKFVCKNCGHVWESKEIIEVFRHCPNCSSNQFDTIRHKINKEKLNNVILGVLNTSVQNQRFIYANITMTEQISKKVLQFLEEEGIYESKV